MGSRTIVNLKVISTVGRQPVTSHKHTGGCTLCHHWMVEAISNIVRIPADNYHAFLSKDLKMSHICRHIVSRILFGRNSAMTNEDS
jgi:hypothetical protein